MKKFIVEIYAVDWCGYSEHYEVEAEDENQAEDIAMEKYEQDFAESHGLLQTDSGWIESEDIDEDGNFNADDCSDFMASVRD